MAFLQDEDDMLTLEAALSFVNEYAIDEVASPSRSEIPVQVKSVDCSLERQQTPARPKNLLVKSTRGRNDPRFELAYLREKVSQLELQLRSLQSSSRHNRLHADHQGRKRKSQQPVATPSNSQLQLAKTWKGLADRQRHRREDTERENARLKLFVERQWKVAMDLSDLLRKRAAGWRHINPLAAEQCLGRMVEFHGSIGDFKELLRHLEKVYQEVDSVLAANGLATMEVPTNDVLIRDGDGGKYLEFFANKVLPFGLHDTREAAWNLFRGNGKHHGNGELYNNAAKVSLFKNLTVAPKSHVFHSFFWDLDQPYTIIEDFAKEIVSNNCRADIKAKQIVRRYTEDDRDIIAFVSRVAPIEIKHKAMFGLTYHLRGYAVTKRSSASTTGHELSLLQLCSRIYIFKEPGVSYESCHSRTLARFLIGNTIGNMRCYQERIENALMDQALSHRLKQ